MRRPLRPAVTNNLPDGPSGTFAREPPASNAGKQLSIVTKDAGIDPRPACRPYNDRIYQPTPSSECGAAAARLLMTAP